MKQEYGVEVWRGKCVEVEGRTVAVPHGGIIGVVSVSIAESPGEVSRTQDPEKIQG